MGFPFFYTFGAFMIKKSIYNSPLGEILIITCKNLLIGLYFENQKEFKDLIKKDDIKSFDERENYNKIEKINKIQEIDKDKKISEDKIFSDTKKWLDIYFSGEEPKFIPKLKLEGTEFRKDVWEILLEIPYGKTITYKDISEKLIASGKYKKMSNQAVGGAVGHNPISLIIPCHRVVGTSGSLTGYAGGLHRKMKLLKLEGINTDKFFFPKNHK